MKNFIAHTEDTRTEMLKSISLNSVEELFKHLPICFKDFNESKPLSEMETQKKIKALAKKNGTDYAKFIGGGIYNKYILSNYHVSDTVTINGDVVSLSIQEQKEDASKEPQFFGRQSSEPQYITKFVRETKKLVENNTRVYKIENPEGKGQ